MSAAEVYELPAPESSKARHFTPVTSMTTMGYTTGPLPAWAAVIEFSAISVLSQIDV